MPRSTNLFLLDFFVEAFEHVGFLLVPLKTLALPLRHPCWNILQRRYNIDEESTGNNRSGNSSGMGMNSLDEGLVLAADGLPAVNCA